MTGEWSEHAEAFAALADGHLQHSVHLFIRVIGREAQLVKTGKARGEASSSYHQQHRHRPGDEPHESPHQAVRYLPRVCGWERAMGRSSNNLERGAEGGETSRWQLGGACRELKQAGQLFLGQAGNHSPKPPHDLAGREQTSRGHTRVQPLIWPRGEEPDTLQGVCAPVTTL